MLTKINAVDLTYNEAKYRGVCRVKYQNEGKSTLEKRNISLNVTFSHSYSSWHKAWKAYAEVPNALKINIKDQILEKKKSLSTCWHQ